MNLIINAGLSEPPSEALYFRHLTLIANDKLHYEILIESRREMIDFYFKYLKKQGMMDYVEEIIIPEYAVEGVRIDYELTYPRTILVKKICCENVLSIFGQINFLRRV